MSYDPPQRRPPRQDRWPNATPPHGWPAYSGRGDYRQTAGYRGTNVGYDGTAGEHGGGASGYWDGGGTAGYDGTAGYGRGTAGYAGTAGYDGGTAGYGGAWDDGAWDGGNNGYDGGSADFARGRAGYLDPGEYLDPLPSGAQLVAPGTLGERGWPPRQSQDRDQDRDQGWDPGWDPDRERDRGGPVVGALTGLLAAGVTIGAGTLAAAFVRPQASPATALGDVLIDRTPPALMNFLMEHVGGQEDKAVLLLGMYAVIAVLATVTGCLARRNGAIGVGGIAAFSLLGAFVVITRPESRPIDVIPAVIGGLAGIAAFAWLAHAASRSAVRHAHAGARRRTG